MWKKKYGIHVLVVLLFTRRCIPSRIFCVIDFRYAKEGRLVFLNDFENEVSKHFRNVPYYKMQHKCAELNKPIYTVYKNKNEPSLHSYNHIMRIQVHKRR